MGYLIGAVIVLVIIAGLAGGMMQAQKKRRRDIGLGELGPDQAGASPFKRNKYFLTTAEQSFYGCLKQAVAGRFELFAKVRLLDLLWLPPNSDGKQGWRNRVQSKHVDFLLCDSKTLLPLLAIELDDASHNRADRQDRDASVAAILEAAGLPLLRIPARSAYDVRALREEIEMKGGTRPKDM